jgi:hypothetical protein
VCASEGAGAGWPRYRCDLLHWQGWGGREVICKQPGLSLWICQMVIREDLKDHKGLSQEGMVQGLLQDVGSFWPRLD